MTFFFSFIIAFIITSLVTPPCIYLIKKIGLIDDPETHKHPGIIHKKPIPRGGGIPLFIGVILTGIFFLPLTNAVLALFFASLIALILGVIDDKYDISPYIRFLVNIVVALIVVGSGITIPFITNPLGGILYLNLIILPIDFGNLHLIIHLSDIIAMLWIIWVMNMLNWSKGVDGQMPGIVAISAIVIGILSLRFAGLDGFSHISANLSFIIAGASLGFSSSKNIPRIWSNCNLSLAKRSLYYVWGKISNCNFGYGSPNDRWDIHCISQTFDRPLSFLA
jgi:UDP-GlcNAc:undecaprenyl-phosphate/decaprenyl-phosphate GlcNAc-1-phosphate transferase